MVLLGALLLLVAEVAAFIAVGTHIGYGWTVLLLLLVSAAGPFIIRRVGIGVLARARQRLADGETPGSELLDGVVVLLAGLLICLPGFVTDAVGLLLMLRPLRRLFIRAAGKGVAGRLRTMSPGRWSVINVSARSTSPAHWSSTESPHDMLPPGPRPDS